MPKSLAGLAALFTVSGVLHLVRPQVFESIVPKQLPRKRELVHASGVAELACAAMLATPRTRRAGGVASAALLVAVFPANVQMAVSTRRSRKAPAWLKAGTLLRLPLQWPMIRVALRAGRA